MRRALRATLAAFAAILATLSGLVTAFLGAAVLGAFFPASPVKADGVRDREIVLLEGSLHTDILLPATPAVRARFAFARGTALPLDAPGLRWLSVGWGSKAFYTTAGNYSDIRLSTAWRAATGDSAVMRLVGFGALNDGPDLRRVSISQTGLDGLLDSIDASFIRDADGPVRVPGATLSPGDVFYEAKGRFHLFNPCNEWARAVLRLAGVGVGAWTPTTYALSASIDRFDR